MQPYLTRLERGLSRLLPLKQFIKLNVDAKIRADIKTRTDVSARRSPTAAVGERGPRARRPTPVPGGDFHNVPAPTADPTNRGDTP
jgi:hypothetical protein